MATRQIRPIRVEGNIAYVPLTKGYEAIIDAHDVGLVEGWSWHAAPSEHTVYAATTDTSGPRPKTLRMHRLLCATPLKVDHINCNGLDNRRANLRPATNSENSCNARLSSRNSSGVKGVRWNAKREKWEVTLRRDRKLRFCGRFDTLQEAADAYAAASLVFHGSFGRTSAASSIPLPNDQISRP